MFKAMLPEYGFVIRDQSKVPVVIVYIGEACNYRVSDFTGNAEKMGGLTVSP
jgi:hypothetical protein